MVSSDIICYITTPGEKKSHFCVILFKHCLEIQSFTCLPVGLSLITCSLCEMICSGCLPASTCVSVSMSYLSVAIHIVNFPASCDLSLLVLELTPDTYTHACTKCIITYTCKLTYTCMHTHMHNITTHMSTGIHSYISTPTSVYIHICKNT